MKKSFFTLLFLAMAISVFSQITVSLPTLTPTPGSIITVPVTLSGASVSGTPISAADIRFTFDPSVLSFIEFSNFYSAMPSSQWFYSGNNTSGLISANWIEPNLLTLEVPDNTVLYEVSFTYLGGSSNLGISFAEFLDASYNPTAGNILQNGSVSPFVQQVITLTLPTLTSTPGSTFSVPVLLSGANDSGTPIVASDIRFSYDPSVLTFTGFTNFYSEMPSSEWFYSGNNTTGLISANWIETSLLPLSIPNNTVLYEVTFIYNGGCSNLDVTFTEFLDETFEPVTNNINQNGSVTATDKNLNVRLFLESLYAGGSTMNPAQGLSGPEWGAGIADHITIELHESASPEITAYSFTDIELAIDGSAIIAMPVGLAGSYYIVVIHRNSIETWSASPVVIDGNCPPSYDFTSNAEQSFGDNLKNVGGVYILWGADATQDGIVDGSDMAAIDNASTAVLAGYNYQDVNGDGIVDGSDMALIDNNSTAIIQRVRPY
ncbi:MAG: hypothetical protein IPH45_06790 [Bacteroidales bacterium]|nr:hypothetical protein [Bacteroidales bacterium]